MKKALAIILLIAGLFPLSLPSLKAATMAFDGYIERNPESYYDWHTLDFIYLQVQSPDTLTVTGKGGTLLDFNFSLYQLGSIVDGRQRLVLASGLTHTYLPDSSLRIDCAATPGLYIIGVDPNASDWDQQDGVVPYFSSDGEPEYANGSYHLQIEGDFTLVNIQEGNLPSAPEPSSLIFAAAGLSSAALRRRR